MSGAPTLMDPSGGATFGSTLRSFRKERGMTQQALADMVRVLKRSVCRYEADERLPHRFTLQRLVIALELNEPGVEAAHLQLLGLWKLQKHTRSLNHLPSSPL